MLWGFACVSRRSGSGTSGSSSALLGLTEDKVRLVNFWCIWSERYCRTSGRPWLKKCGAIASSILCFCPWLAMAIGPMWQLADKPC